MNGIIELSMIQVAIAYVFVLVVLLLSRWRGIGREKEIILASIRMTLQLVLVGYLLVFIFERPHPLITLLIIVIMEAFAIHTAIRKQSKNASAALKRILALSMIVGTLSCLLIFLLVIVRISPWYNPQYFIPLAGMLIGNSMTGISLGAKQLHENMTDQKARVEQSLILGATPQQATRLILNQTFDSAIMPTINNMLGMGIVFLPGMMTGQILSGTTPTTAIAYQIAIMLAILGAVSITVMMMLQLGYKTYFNQESQLID